MDHLGASGEHSVVDLVVDQFLSFPAWIQKSSQLTVRVLAQRGGALALVLVALAAGPWRLGAEALLLAAGQPAAAARGASAFLSAFSPALPAICPSISMSSRSRRCARLPTTRNSSKPH